MPTDWVRQILVSAIMPFLGKLVYLAALWLLKKLIKLIHYISTKTKVTWDDEIVELMEKSLKLQEEEPVPMPPSVAP